MVHWPHQKANLVEALVQLREKYLQLQGKVKQLEQENALFYKQIEKEKIRDTNKEVRGCCLLTFLKISWKTLSGFGNCSTASVCIRLVRLSFFKIDWCYVF
jgi:hypothetical protein